MKPFATTVLVSIAFAISGPAATQEASTPPGCFTQPQANDAPSSYIRADRQRADALFSAVAASGNDANDALGAFKSTLVRNPTTELTVRQEAPSWWKPRLPEPVGKLPARIDFLVLDHKRYSTIFGQDDWILVETQSKIAGEHDRLRGWVHFYDPVEFEMLHTVSAPVWSTPTPNRDLQAPVDDVDINHQDNRPTMRKSR